MPMNRAMLAVCSLLCAMLASCGKSRIPSAIDGAAGASAGAGAAESEAGAAAGANAGASARSGGAGDAAGGADAGGGAAGTAGGEAGAAAGSSGAPTGGSSGTQPPLPSCGGAPWYRCYEACPGQLILQGAARSFGECAGDCSFTLEIRPVIVLDDGNCAGMFASLTVQNTDGSRRTYEGELTETAWEQTVLLSIELAAVRTSIPDVSGCPDCADGGSASIVIDGLDQLTETFTYEYDNPPAELRAADEFMQGLIDALLACDGPPLESCTLTVVNGDPDTPTNGPACGFVYTAMTAAVSCVMPIDVERPCAAAVECLCGSEVLPGALTDLDSCVASWLAPRGAITFADVCTQGQTDVTTTLSSALASFADTYGATLTTTSECDSVSAFY